jgi:putative transposase
MLTVTRLGLPRELRRSLGLHQHHRECHGHGAQGLPQRQILALALDGPAMAAAAMQEAVKGFRRLKAYKHLPALRAALAKQRQQPPSDEALVQITEAA